MKRWLAIFRAKSEVVSLTTDRTINFHLWKSIVHPIRRRERSVFSLVKVHRSHRWLHWLWLNTERCFHHCHSVSKSQYLYNKKKDKPKIERRWWDGIFTEDSKDSFSPASIVLTDSNSRYIKPTFRNNKDWCVGDQKFCIHSGNNSARTTVSLSQPSLSDRSVVSLTLLRMGYHQASVCSRSYILITNVEAEGLNKMFLAISCEEWLSEMQTKQWRGYFKWDRSHGTVQQ